MQRPRHSLSAATSMATVSLILVCLGGCGPTTKVGGGSNTTPDSGEFAPDDFEATRRWIASVLQPVAEAEKQNNKLRADEQLENANARLNELSGRKVSWRFKVKSVDGKQVHLETYDLTKYFPKDKLGATTTLEISALAEGTPPGPLPPGGDWGGITYGTIGHKDFRGDIEIGNVISKDQAKRLASGKEVLVTGKLAYCVASGVRRVGSSDPLNYGYRAVALCIVEAKCPE